ncbi:hypothetical protein [Pontiella sp.]|uniref:hypothetical protein n=1 Tax=Pontiella sp. TaxID=2837462 RepID=UPI003566AB71
MKKISILIMGLLVGFMGVQTQASTVYEGFDYADGTNVWGQAGGEGWEGVWVGTDTDAAGRGIPEVGTGLTFTNLTVTGGAYVRPQRYGVAQSSRTISTASQAALTADNTTIWFSVLMKPNAGGSTGGFAANSHGTIVLGDTAFIDSVNPGLIPPTIGANGNALGVGFDGDGASSDNIGLQGVIYTNGVTVAGSAERILVGDNTVMVVGKIDWAADGTDDVLSLYNISDPLAELPEPFTTMSNDWNQATFNLVAIGSGQTEMFDEIRFGTSLSAVGVGGVTVDAAVLSIDYAAGFVTVGATNLTAGTINYLQSSTDLVAGSWSNLYSVSGVTETNWTISTEDTPVFFRVESGE